MTESVKPFVLDFGQVFEDYIKSIEKTWHHDRSQSVGASEAFGCIRANFFKKRGKELGFEPDPEYEMDWGPTERGNMIENHFVVPAMKFLPKGVELMFGGDAQTTLIKDRSSSTPDGLFTGIPKGPVTIKYRDHVINLPEVDSGCIGLEIKSIDPRAVLTEERAKHRGQSIMGLGLIRETTEYKPNYWVILYINASFLSEITPFVVTYDENVYQAGKDRADQVWEAEGPLDLFPEGKLANDCNFCQWTIACGEASLRAIAEGVDTPLDNPFIIGELEAKGEAFLLLKEKAKETEEELERAKEDIKVFMATHGLNKASTDQFRVTWSKVKGRAYVDTKAIAATGFDIKPYTKDGNPYDVLKVTPRKVPNVE